MAQVGEYTVTQNPGQGTFTITSKTSYKFNIMLSQWPTGNCQLSSVGYMNHLFEYVKNNNDVKAILKECYNILVQAPMLVLMDVRNTYIKRIEECFKVVHKHEYVSTNGSQMCLFMVTL